MLSGANRLNHNSERTYDSIDRRRETWKGKIGKNILNN